MYPASGTQKFPTAERPLFAYGAKGSIRLDLVEGDLRKPTVIYDLKTGKAGLSARRIAQIRLNLPDEWGDVPIVVVRP